MLETNSPLESGITDITGTSDLSILGNSRNHFLQAAKWARFLAILAFVIYGFVMLLFVFGGSSFMMMDSGVEDFDASSAGVLTGVFVFYGLIFTVTTLVPAIFLYIFASKMITAIDHNSNMSLEASAKNLKHFFMFYGVIAIIYLGFMVLGLLMFMVGGAFASF